MEKLIFFILFFSFQSFAQEHFDRKLGEQEEALKSDEVDPIILSFGESLKILDQIMSKIISRDQFFAIPLQNPISIPKWKRFSGRFSQIEVGEDGTTFGITSKNEIYLLKDKKWLRYPGKVKNLCISNTENIWGIGETEQIYKLDFKKNKWIPKKGRAKYISCGYDGTVVAIHTDEDSQRYQLPLGSMIILEKDRWINFSGQLDKVTVAAKDDIWGLKKSGSVWHFDGESWEKMPGEMLSISVAHDKTIISTGLNGGAYIWNGKDWVNVPGINLIKIEAVKNGYYMGLTGDGFVWKSNALEN